ncbi:hypothetical protein TKK_0015108 [Trichogramma kaykai]
MHLNHLNTQLTYLHLQHELERNRRNRRERDPGPKLTYDPTWTGPLNVSRSMTDAPALVALVVFFIYWVGIAAYGKDELRFYCNKPMRTAQWILIVLVPFAAVLSFAFIASMRNSAKSAIFRAATLLLLTLVLALCFWGLLLSDRDRRQRGVLFLVFNSSLIVIIVVVLILLILWLISSDVKSMQDTADIIQESAEALMFVPAIFLHSLLLYVLVLAVVGFSLAVQCCLHSNRELHLAFLVVNSLIEIACCLWFGSFLASLLRLIVAGDCCVWYWTRNRRELVPADTTSRVVDITFKCVALLLLIASAIIVYDNSKLKWTARRYCLGVAAMTACCAAGGQIQRHDCTYPWVMLHAQAYSDATLTADNLWMRNFVRIDRPYDRILRALICCGLAVAGCACLLYKGALLVLSLDRAQSMPGQLFACFVIIMTVCWMFVPLRAAIDSVLICALMDFEVNAGSSRPHYMSNKLKKIIFETRPTTP